MPSSEGISTEVRQNPNAIGYDGLGYVTPDQKVIAVGRDPGGPFSGLPPAVYVHRRGADRGGQGVSGLDSDGGAGDCADPGVCAAEGR